MSWIPGIRDEINRSARQLAEGRAHFVLEVPPGWQIAWSAEKVPKTGGERIHAVITAPIIPSTPPPQRK